MTQNFNMNFYPNEIISMFFSDMGNNMEGNFFSSRASGKGRMDSFSSMFSDFEGFEN